MAHSGFLRLRRWRKRAKLTQAQVGARCGRSKVAVCGWESGERAPALEDAFALEVLSRGEVRPEDFGFERQAIDDARAALAARAVARENGAALAAREARS